MDAILETITLLLSTDLKYLAIFIAGLIEGTPILGTVFPGGTISFLIGTYVQTGFFNPWIAMVLLISANFIGDMIGYGMGRIGHKINFIRKIIEKEKLGHAWEVFEKKLFYFVVLGRVVPVVRSIPSLLAGARMIPIKKYVWYSFLGSTLWGFVGIWGGFLTRMIIGQYAWAVIVGVVVVVTVWGYFKKSKK